MAVSWCVLISKLFKLYTLSCIHLSVCQSYLNKAVFKNKVGISDSYPFLQIRPVPALFKFCAAVFSPEFSRLLSLSHYIPNSTVQRQNSKDKDPRATLLSLNPSSPTY
jgi:hypothetical protein